MEKKRILFLVLICMLTISVVSAHNSRIVYDQSTSKDDPIIIQNPEVSQAFYGSLKGDAFNPDLKGSPDYYLINSSKNFNINLGLLIPYFDEVKEPFTDFKINVYSYNNNKLLFEVNGIFQEWEKYYEPFFGDYYWKAPEAGRMNVSKGAYIIEVSNSASKGSYVLVVGKEEKWSIKEIFNSLAVAPKLKKDFFYKSMWSAYFNRFGLYVLGFVAVIAILVLLIVFWWRKRGRKQRKRDRE